MTATKRKELTDPACRNAKPKEKTWKLHDVRGLFLLVNPDGSKWWRLRYTLNGKDGLMSLGVYPDGHLLTRVLALDRGSCHKALAENTYLGEVLAFAPHNRRTSTFDAAARVKVVAALFMRRGC